MHLSGTATTFVGLVEAECVLLTRKLDGSSESETVRSLGTAYLVDARRAVTCGHVVQHVVERRGDSVTMIDGATVTVTFGESQISATVLRLDPAANVAVLELRSEPAGVPTVPVGTASAGPCAFAGEAGGKPLSGGFIVNPKVEDRFGDPRMTVRAPELAALMIEPGHGYAGTPLLVGDRVVGHTIGALRDPNDIEKGFAGLVEAVPGRAVIEVLGPLLIEGGDGHSGDGAASSPGRPPSLRRGFRTTLVQPGDAAPPAQDEGPADRLAAPRLDKARKEKHHAFLSYRAIEVDRANDSSWAVGLMDRLGSFGYQTFAAPHVVFGPEPFGSAYQKALDRSRAGLLIFSRRSLTGPPLKDHIKPLLKRLKKGSDGFRLVVVRLDGTPLPDELAGIPVIDVGDRGLSLGRQTLPDSAAVREIALALQGEPAHVSEVRTLDTATQSLRGASGGMRGPGGPLIAPPRDLDSELGAAADGVLGELQRVRKEPKMIRAVAMRWLAAGLPGSDVPVEAARLLVDRQAFDAALEVLDRAREALAARGDDAPRRDRARIDRMRGAALGEADRFDEAIEVLEKLDSDGMLDQWSGGILASNYKQKWLRLGKRHRALLQRAYDVYRDTFARTLHYYPGINAATLAMHLGREDEGREIATRIREQLEAVDDIYFWDEASLGEACLLLGEHEKAIEAYSSAAVQAMGSTQNLVRMRRQLPLILGDPGEDERIERTREVLASLFDTGKVAACVGPAPDLASPADFVARRERLVRRRIRAALDRHDVSVGFSSLASSADIVFVEAVLERFGEAHVILPYPRVALRETIPPGPWRERFDRILGRGDVPPSKGVYETVLADEVPSDGMAARRGCLDTILDRALAHARAREEEPLLIAVQSPADEHGHVATAVRSARDEGIEIDALELGEDLDRPEVTTAQPDAGGGPDPEDPAGSEDSAEPSGTPVTTPEPADAGPDQRPGDRGVQAPQRPATQEAGRASGDYRKRHLLVVGIDSYMDWRPLANARSDAVGIRDTLVEHFGFDLSRELYDRDATRSAIEDAFVAGLGEGKGLSGDVEPDDLVVFFFAGHGHTERRPNDEEEGFLVPVEGKEGTKNGLLRITDIRNWTNDLAARHVLYIFDSCFSGTATTGGGGGGKPGHARLVITAGAPDQVVADGGKDWKDHSVFTGRLLYGLSPAETALEKPVYAMELATYLVRRVPEDAKAVGAREPQTPSYGTLPGHGGATIVLKPSGAGEGD